ncbi:MAG: DNA-binding domain-containing protein [Anaeromyxobacteraceae bacterium]
MTLAETQALFHEILSAPGSVDPRRIEECFAGTPDLPAIDRLTIYSDMYLWRLVDALRETFPNVVRYLGDEQFAALAEDYVRRNPSEHHDVGRVGRLLAVFLRSYPDPERPDLADLAELEWARHQVFFAAPAEPAGPEAFAALTPEVFARTSLVLSPALRVLVLDHDAASLWRRLEDGEPPGRPSAVVCAVAVWRRGFDVVHAPVSMDEALALEGAAAGHSLASICASFSEQEDPTASAHAALASWIREGWIAGLADPAPVQLLVTPPMPQGLERAR